MIKHFKYAKGLHNLALVLFSLYGANASAACYRTIPAPKTFSMDAGSIVVPNDAQIGQTFFSRTFNISPPRGNVVNCVGRGTTRYRPLLGTPVAGLTNVYTTAMDGIGYRIKYNFGGSGHGNLDLPYTSSYANQPLYLGNPQTFVLELIKTGPSAQGGPIGNGPIMAMLDDNNNQVMRATISAAVTRLILPSCAIQNKVISVPMGRWHTNQFKGLNSLVGTRNFDIELNCQNRNPDTVTSYITIDAARETESSETGILRLTNKGNPGVAEGIGIKLVRNTGPVTGPVELGKEAEIGKDLPGQYKLSYTASYIQIGSKVTPGRADSQATLTLTYR